MALLIALLDKPSKESLAIVAAVVKEEDKTVRVLGLSATSAHLASGLKEREVKELIESGHALKIEDVIVKDRLADNTVALCLGYDFQEGAKEAGVDFMSGSIGRPIIVFEGKIFLLPSEVAYRLIEDWVVSTFKTFRSVDAGERVRRKKISSLLSWALPSRPEALAASWAVSVDPEHELAWQIRTLRHGVTPETLRKSHESIL